MKLTKVRVTNLQIAGADAGENRRRRGGERPHRAVLKSRI